jgi:hypothetical protein
MTSSDTVNDAVAAVEAEGDGVSESLQAGARFAGSCICAFLLETTFAANSSRTPGFAI